MRKFIALTAVATALLVSQLASYAQDSDGALAIIVPGGGTYSRATSLDSEAAQQFYDQGLRMAWGFYFPEQRTNRSIGQQPEPEFQERRRSFRSPGATQGAVQTLVLAT